MRHYDYIVIGGGIIGLASARALKRRVEHAKILLIEKEPHVAEHASGRNSGVIHSGFYYSANSLKAKFCVAGNQAMRKFCADHRLEINSCGKLVVAKDQDELEKLYELEKRGIQNGVRVQIISAEEARKMEPNIRTFEAALWSPDDAVADPLQVARALERELRDAGVEFQFHAPYRGHSEDGILVGEENISCGHVVNAAGLYADKIARDFGFSKNFTIIPFKGLYLKYSGEEHVITKHIYPVPNLKNPFLGVHYTLTVDGHIKIGPTAIPAFWRENYRGLSRFRFDEFVEIASWEMKLFLTNSFRFRSLAFEEMRKYVRSHFVGLAQSLAGGFRWEKFDRWIRPGIRAQLLNKHTLELVQDFVVEGDSRSTHFLNAVSPGWTCSFPFAEHVVDEWILSERK